MASDYTEWIEQPPQAPLTIDRRGMSAERRFSIYAKSDVAAYNILRTDIGVQRGSLYVNTYGEQPHTTLACEDITIEAKKHAVVGGTGHYIAICHYLIPEWQFAEPDENAAPVYDWDGDLVTEPIDTDQDGDPIANSAGEPYDPPVTDQVSRTVLNVIWYASSFSTRTLISYRNSVNSDDWDVGDGSGRVYAGEAWMRQLRRTPVNNNLLRMQSQIVILPLVTISGTDYSPFDKRIRDKGYRKLIAADGDNPAGLEEIKIEGERPTEPVDLDGAGGILAAGVDKVIRIHQVKPRKAFTALGI